MIIGIFTLISMLLGGGNLEVFYLDKIDKGVKEYVTDKEHKKELQSILKEYTKAVKEFNKKRKGHIEDLKKKNLDRNTPDKWYLDFFNTTMEERKKLQATFIDGRIELQQKITNDEWANIITMASDEAAKIEEKEQKKEEKKKGQDIFQKLSNTIEENISDEEKRASVLESLKDFKKTSEEIVEAYENINVNESAFLADKNATRDQMQKASEGLNLLREKMYDSYVGLINNMKKNTTDEEWTPISKEFNKL